MFESTDQQSDHPAGDEATRELVNRSVIRHYSRYGWLLLASSLVATVTLWSLAAVPPAPRSHQAVFNTSYTTLAIARVHSVVEQPRLPATATAETLATATGQVQEATPTPLATATAQPTPTPQPTATAQPTPTPMNTPSPQPTTAVATPTPISTGQTNSIGTGTILAIIGVLLLIALVVMVAILLARRNRPPTDGPGAGYHQQQPPTSQAMPPPYPPVTPPLEQEQNTYWRQTEWRQTQQEAQGQFPAGSPGQTVGPQSTRYQPTTGEGETTSPLLPGSSDQGIPDPPGTTFPDGDPGRDPA
jgi:hypothetical protein